MTRSPDTGPESSRSDASIAPLPPGERGGGEGSEPRSLASTPQRPLGSSLAAPPLSQLIAAAAAAWQRLRAGQSLEPAVAAALAAVPGAGRSGSAARLAPAVHDVVYACARRRALIDALVARLVRRRAQPQVEALLGVALGLLLAQAYAAHTVVDQAVAAARAGHAPRAAGGFVNAVLRSFLRDRAALVASCMAIPAVHSNLPDWWLARLQAEHPHDWRAVVAAQGQPPPLVLRVNRRRSSVASYLARLAEGGVEASALGGSAVWLHRPRPVAAIDGFADGLVSVQDAGAQLAAPWLQAAGGMRVLDACAAPGGKTAHLLELADIELDALERDPQRAARIEANLARLGLQQPAGQRRVRLLVADGRTPATFWDGRPYDRILLDAPCTGSGVVRRHPDIPWLRRNTDVADLATQQAALLEALWPLLAPAGRLLYVVCSVFADEGVRLAAAFAAAHPDARASALGCCGSATLQLLPRDRSNGGEPRAGLPGAGSAWEPEQHDGFFFAMFEKHSS